MIMSESQDLDVDIENAEDDTTVVVTDSENYGETQRLKQIYKLRSKVQDLKMNKNELSKEYDDYWSNRRGWEIFEEDLAGTVALYGSELLPLFNSIEQITEEDYKVTISKGKSVDIRLFVDKDGNRVNDGQVEAYPSLFSMAVYRRLNKLVEKSGLGLETESETEPASI
jgi:hypothetical protein